MEYYMAIMYGKEVMLTRGHIASARSLRACLRAHIDALITGGLPIEIYDEIALNLTWYDRALLYFSLLERDQTKALLHKFDRVVGINAALYPHPDDARSWKTRAAVYAPLVCEYKNGMSFAPAIRVVPNTSLNTDGDAATATAIAYGRPLGVLRNNQSSLRIFFAAAYQADGAAIAHLRKVKISTAAIDDLTTAEFVRAYLRDCGGAGYFRSPETAVVHYLAACISVIGNVFAHMPYKVQSNMAIFAKAFTTLPGSSSEDVLKLYLYVLNT